MDHPKVTTVLENFRFISLSSLSMIVLRAVSILVQNLTKLYHVITLPLLSRYGSFYSPTWILFIKMLSCFCTVTFVSSFHGAERTDKICRYSTGFRRYYSFLLATWDSVDLNKLCLITLCFMRSHWPKRDLSYSTHSFNSLLILSTRSNYTKIFVSSILNFFSTSFFIKEPKNIKFTIEN